MYRARKRPTHGPSLLLSPPYSIRALIFFLYLEGEPQSILRFEIGEAHSIIVQCAREQMGIRANGNLVPKFPKHQNGKLNSLQVIREEMGIRANGNIPGISCNWPLNGIPFARERTVGWVPPLGRVSITPNMSRLEKS